MIAARRTGFFKIPLQAEDFTMINQSKEREINKKVFFAIFFFVLEIFKNEEKNLEKTFLKKNKKYNILFFEGNRENSAGYWDGFRNRSRWTIFYTWAGSFEENLDLYFSKRESSREENKNNFFIYNRWEI